MRVLLSISTIFCLTVLNSSLAFDPFGSTFHSSWHRDLLDFTRADSDEDLWPFAHHNSRERVAASNEGTINDGRDTEPIDLSYVEGPIVDADRPSEPAVKPTKPDEYNPAQFPSNMFNQHFNNFFGPGIFGNPFASFGLFDFPRYQPWWKGPNVCKVREEDLENPDDQVNEGTSEVEMKADSNEQLIQAFQLNLETCVEKANKYECKKIINQRGKKRTFTVTYKCCPGYGRRRSGLESSPCEKLELESLDKTIENLGAKEFMRSANKTLVEEEMKDVTVFAPVDASFTEFAERMLENNLVVVPLNPNSRTRRETKGEQAVNTRDLVQAHMIDGIYDIEEIENEQILTTRYNTTVRLNVFPRPPSDRNYDYPYSYTANCVPILKPNVMATNGMVHMIKGVLLPPEKTVMEMLKERPDMAVFTTVLERTKLDKMLMDETKHFTILAPTDSAFEKLEPQLRKKLKEGRGCASNILKNHILDLTFCSSAVAENAKTSAYNLLGEKLEFEFNEDNAKNDGNEIADMTNVREILVNGEARLIAVDMMGTNGVVHIIDAMLPTESAQPATQTMKEQNSTVFEQLLAAGNLNDYVDDLMNATLFVPTDRAFESSEYGRYWLEMLDKSPAKLKNNEELKAFIDNHISQPLIKTCDLNAGNIKSKADRDLRVNLYSTNFPFVNVMNRATVNCARLLHFDEDSCGSVIHIVSAVLEAPKLNLLEMLRSNEKYSSFLKLIEDHDLTSLLEDPKENLTLLIPKNEVFQEVDDFFAEMSSSKQKAEQFVKTHILPEVLCCAGISQSQWPFVRTVQAMSNVDLRLDRDRRPKVQNAGITKCDIVATNGIIHEINDIIAPAPKAQAPPNRFQDHFEHWL